MKSATENKKAGAENPALDVSFKQENATMNPKITYTIETAAGEVVKTGVLLVVEAPKAKNVGRRVCQVKMDDEPTPRWVPVRCVDFVC